MQRVLAVFLAVLMVLTVGVGSATARRGDREPSFRVKASQHAVPGGFFRVALRVKHAPAGASLSATAVVHFASGDVELTLVPKGRAFVATGRTRVADEETGGTVPVDVTISLGDETVVASGAGHVDGPEPEPEPEPDPPIEV